MPTGMSLGKLRVHLYGPLQKPVPIEQVWVFAGYGYRYIQKYLGVTMHFTNSDYEDGSYLGLNSDDEYEL